MENEYGSYGNDTEYLRYLADGLRRRGLDIPFFTSDGASNHMLISGEYSVAMFADAFAAVKHNRTVIKIVLRWDI